MSLLKKVIIFVLLLFLGFVLTVFVISKIYQSEVTQYINQEINTSFADQVYIEQLSDITFFRSFPNLSITAQHVRIYELWSQKNKKELAIIPKAHLEIDLWKLVQGQMVFPEISIENAQFYLLHDGMEGYNFIRSESEDSSSSLFLHLEKITIHNTQIYWAQQGAKQSIAIQANDLSFQGLFAKDQYEVSIQGDFFMIDYDSLPGLSIRNIPMQIDASANINTTNQKYVLNACTFVLNREITAQGNGVVELSKEARLNIKLEAFDLPKLFPFISDTNVQKTLAQIKCTGSVGGDLVFRKDLKNNKIQDFSIKGFVRNSSFAHDSLPVSIDQVSGVFDLSQADSLLVLRLDSFQGNMMDGFFKARAFMPNILKKEASLVWVDVEKIPLQKLALLFPVASLEFLEGTLSGAFKIDSSKITARMNIEKTAIRYKDQEINEIYAKLYYHDKQVDIQSLSGRLQNRPWDASGVLSWDTSVTSKHSFVLHMESLDLEPFISDQYSADQTSNLDQTQEIQWPAMLGRVYIDQLKYQKILLHEVDVILDAQKGFIRFPSIRFKGFKGSVEGKALLSIDSLNQVQFQGQCSFENMDVKHFLYSFDNFSQTFITDAHLSGIVHGNSLFTIPFSKEGNVVYNKIEAQSDWTVENGRLISFEPLQEICTFIQQKKLYAAFIDYKTMSQKFKLVQFQKMSNSFFIKNGRLHIPKMSVQSSALHFEVQGIHSFNDSIDYQLDFFLSDLLKKKESGLEDGIWEIKKEDKKWLKMYVGMNGTTNNPQFYMRKKETVDRIEEISKQEKSTIKSMLKTDFGLYSKDTTIQRYQSKPAQRQMQFEHPEFKKEPVQEKLPEEKKPKSSPFLNSKPIEKEKEDYVPEE